MSLEVQNVMVRNVITIERHTTVRDAVRIMNQHGIGCIVVTEDGRAIGIVTERDLLTRVLAESKNPEKTGIKEIMSTPLIVGKPDMEIDEIAKVMLDRKIKKLPIVEDGKLLGIVTFTDLLSFQPTLIKVVKQLTHPHSWNKATENKVMP